MEATQTKLLDISVELFASQGFSGVSMRGIARAAGISPETLRKIEVGRLPSPGFGTVVGLCDALGLPLEQAVEAWRGDGDAQLAM